MIYNLQKMSKQIKRYLSHKQKLGPTRGLAQIAKIYTAQIVTENRNVFEKQKVNT